MILRGVACAESEGGQGRQQGRLFLCLVRMQSNAKKRVCCIWCEICSPSCRHNTSDPSGQSREGLIYKCGRKGKAALVGAAFFGVSDGADRNRLCWKWPCRPCSMKTQGRDNGRWHRTGVQHAPWVGGMKCIGKSIFAHVVVISSAPKRSGCCKLSRLSPLSKKKKRDMSCDK